MCVRADQPVPSITPPMSTMSKIMVQKKPLAKGYMPSKTVLERIYPRMMATKWANFLISIWAICTLVDVVMTSNNMLHAAILIVSTLFAWLAKRIFIRSYILTTSLPQLPQLFPGLRILARDSKIATRALLAYHHIPQRYSIPLIVFLQGGLVFVLTLKLEWLIGVSTQLAETGR